jgi:hypothetical protein
MASEQVASFEPQHGILGHGEIVARLRSKDLVISPILSKDQIGAASVSVGAMVGIDFPTSDRREAHSS